MAEPFAVAEIELAGGPFVFAVVEPAAESIDSLAVWVFGKFASDWESMDERCVIHRFEMADCCCCARRLD